MKGCRLVEQGYETGSCQVVKGEKEKPACKVTLKKEDGELHRMIKSMHHSVPEYYFSIYQSGCNLSCKFCHSWTFTQFMEGDWVTPSDIARRAEKYEAEVNVKEPQERATSFHAESAKEKSSSTPVRNIVGFTGGDVTCCPEFYAQCTRKIKKRTDLKVLIETNGYGLTDKNLQILDKAGVDSFWLDIKAFDEKRHKELTGVRNERILNLPEKLSKRGFVFEVSSLYIPNCVELEELRKVAVLLSSVDENIPFEILAYFPEHQMTNRPPKTEEVIDAYKVAKGVGLKNVRLGNVGVSAKDLEAHVDTSSP